MIGQAREWRPCAEPPPLAATRLADASREKYAAYAKHTGAQMPDERKKSVRIDENLNKAINTLAGFYDQRADKVVARAINKLWQETFPGTPFPAEPTKPARRK
jgi:hypothetical protein